MRLTNCADDDIEMAITEIELVQARNTRSQSDKSYHLVISFFEGERPTLEQLRDIEDHLVAAIGFSEHQRISAVHDDTDNLHVHVAINKVHPKTLRNVAPHNDYPKLMAACRELELRHGLLLDNHGLLSDQIHNLGQDAVPTRTPERAKTMEAHSGRQSLSGWIATHAREDILTDTLSREAAFLALALASDRFPGQPLVVEGSPTFRAAVLEMSLQPWLEVTFADPALEKARRSVTHEEERNHPSREPVRRASTPKLRGEDRSIQAEAELGRSRGRSGPELSL